MLRKRPDQLERPAAQVLHRDEWTAVGRDVGVVHRDDVRVPAQPAHDLTLPAEAPLTRLVLDLEPEHLQCDDAADPLLMGAVHLAVAALTDKRQIAVPRYRDLTAVGCPSTLPVDQVHAPPLPAHHRRPDRDVL